MGMKLRWAVFSIRRLKTISSPGIRVNTERMLKRMAFTSTMPRSRPMPNCMNIMAMRPARVVRQLEEISGMDLLKARMQASRAPAR